MTERIFTPESKERQRQGALNSVRIRRSRELRKAWEDQDKIRGRYVRGERVQAIADEYGVTRRSIYRIIKI